MSNKFNFDRVLKNIERMKTELPKILANDAKKYFNDTFKNEAWDGVKWQTPNRKIENTKEWKYPKKGADRRRTRQTLVQTGTLRRAVATSLVRADFYQIKFEVKMPKGEEYPIYHNEGTGNLPKRQFMGDSPILRKQLKEKIEIVSKKIWGA